ncbi:MAG: RHS repeat-associated core domain-containing protein, partial [Pyrinomonadaceae bacterium]
DAENHQKEVKDASNVTIGQYLYDGEGKRVKKISNTETTVFVYTANGQLVAEYSTALAQTQQVSYLTNDHLGSPRVTTNEDGLVTNRKDYSAFGEESFSSQRTSSLGYTGGELRKGYTGYEKDFESGLDFAQARYYSSTHGRYTSVDPLTASASIRNPQTFNRYSYVLNSPYKFTDPLGLIPVTTGACGGSCPNSGPTGGYGSSYSKDKQGSEQPEMPCPPGKNCWTDSKGDKHWIGDDGLDVVRIETTAGDIEVGDVNLGTQLNFSGRRFLQGLTAGSPLIVAGAMAGTEEFPGLGTIVGVAVGACGALICGIINAVNIAESVQTTAIPTTVTDNPPRKDPMIRVFRVAGGASPINGPWWSPDDPRLIPNYRGAAALPFTNTGEILAEGYVRDTNIVYRGITQPNFGHPGGAVEYRVRPGSVNIVRTIPLVPRL